MTIRLTDAPEQGSPASGIVDPFHDGAQLVDPFAGMDLRQAAESPEVETEKVQAKKGTKRTSKNGTRKNTKRQDEPPPEDRFVYVDPEDQAHSNEYAPDQTDQTSMNGTSDPIFAGSTYGPETSGIVGRVVENEDGSALLSIYIAPESQLKVKGGLVNRDFSIDEGTIDLNYAGHQSRITVGPLDQRSSFESAAVHQVRLTHVPPSFDGSSGTQGSF